MANRFYQTTEGRFVDKNMYEVPWELMQAAINTHETRTDKLVAETDLLSNSIDTIKHLDFDAENQRVQALQNKYSTMIDDLTTKIVGNPLEYQKYLPSIKKAQRELLQDKTSGEWSDIEQRYAAFTKWKEDNKKMKTEEPGTYNALEKHWYEDVVKRATENPAAEFKGQQIVGKTDLIKGYQKIFQDIKANSTPTSDGNYIYQNEVLTEQQVAKIAWNTLASDPNYAAYAQQQGGILGQAGFYDEDGKAIQPFYWADASGARIPFDAIKEMTPEQQKGVRKVLNPEHAFYTDLQAVASIYSFQDTEMEADEFAKIGARGGVQSKLQQQKAQDARILEADKQRGREKIQSMKNQAALDKLQKAYNLEKGIAEEEGDIVTLDNISVATRPYQVVTIEEQQTLGKEYTELHSKVLNGDINSLSQADQIKYNKMRGLYESVGIKHGNEILQAAGEDPSAYGNDALGERQKQARVTQLLTEMMQLNDPSFGIKKVPVANLMEKQAMFPKRTFEAEKTDSSQRDRVQNIKDSFTDAVGDFDEVIAESMVITRGFMPVGKGNQTSEVGTALVNTLWQSGVEPIVQDINLLTYDIDNRERGGSRVDIDTSWFGSGKTSNPLQAIMNQVGAVSPEQLSAKGYGKFRWREDRGDIIVDFIPNNDALKKAGIDTGDRRFPKEGFSMRHKNITGNVWENLKDINGMDNATLNQMRLHGDITYGEAAQNVDMNVASLKSTGESYPFIMGGIPETMFKITYDPSIGKYKIFQTYSKGDQAGTWDDLERNKIYKQTSDPEILKLYLREQVIEAHQNKQ